MPFSTRADWRPSSGPPGRAKSDPWYATIRPANPAPNGIRTAWRTSSSMPTCSRCDQLLRRLVEQQYGCGIRPEHFCNTRQKLDQQVDLRHASAPSPSATESSPGDRHRHPVRGLNMVESILKSRAPRHRHGIACESTACRSRGSRQRLQSRSIVSARARYRAAFDGVRTRGRSSGRCARGQVGLGFATPWEMRWSPRRPDSGPSGVMDIQRSIRRLDEFQQRHRDCVSIRGSEKVRRRSGR